MKQLLNFEFNQKNEKSITKNKITNILFFKEQFKNTIAQCADIFKKSKKKDLPI